jgi:hypothetical protein
MYYEAQITKNAIEKNTEMNKPIEYAESLCDAYSELETFKVFIKWINLDNTNRQLVAEELGITLKEFNIFLAVNKAIYNGGKVEKPIF